MRRTTPDSVTLASLIKITGLFSALLWLGLRVTTRGECDISILERHHRDALFDRTRVGAQHVQTRTIGHDFPFHDLTFGLVVVDYVLGVVERQIHRRLVVLVHLVRDLF